jgi:hypothetical protein
VPQNRRRVSASAKHFHGGIGGASRDRIPEARRWPWSSASARFDGRGSPCCYGHRLMARTRFTDPIEPMDLANMRQNGVRSLDIQCHNCRHRVIMNVDHLSGGLTVPSFGPKMVCTKCGMIGADVRPNWRECDR